MPKYVALLRGVNVGRAKRVPMADLRRLLQELGFGDVKTLLNSGNAIFTYRAGSTPRIAEQIRQILLKNLDVDVLTIVKTANEMAEVEQENTLVTGSTNPSRLLVAFAGDAAALKLLNQVAPRIKRSERFLIGSHAAYLSCPKGILQSPAAEAILGMRGQAITTRNWATVVKLNALLR